MNPVIRGEQERRRALQNPPRHIYRRRPYLHMIIQRLGLLVIGALTCVLLLASCGAIQ